MDLNQPLSEELLSLSVSHYSMMGSIHPMHSNEDSKTQMGGSCGAPEVMPEWFSQLLSRTNDNNSHWALEQFQKMKPPIFVGEVDPLQAEGWLLQIEKILNVMNCTEEQKVSFSSFMFQKEAEH